MTMSCATSTLKFTVILLNLLCWLAGVLILAASIYGLQQFDEFTTIRNRLIFSLTVDSALLLFTMFACIAALKESVRLLWIYVAFMVILIGAQMGYAWFSPTNFRAISKDVLDTLWNKQLNNQTTEMLNTLQRDLHCCGKVGPSDYPDSGLPIPPSCYFNQNLTDAVDLYTDGCDDALATFISNQSYVEQISDWSLIGIEGFTLIIAVIMTISLNHVQRRLRYR